MRYLFSLVFLVLLAVLVQPGAVAFADSPEMPGYDAQRVRLHLKAGGYLDVRGPVRCRGGIMRFRLDGGLLVSLPSDRVKKAVPIEEPVVVEKPAKVEPPVDPSAPVPVYELRGDQAEPGDESESGAEPVDAEDPAPAEGQAEDPSRGSRLGN